MLQDGHVNTKYKDTVFRLLFSDKKRLLSLYNAMSGRPCNSVDDLKVVTLENAIYMEVKNDIAFLLGDCLHLWEHQSIRNPNMPLRFLEYIATEYQGIVKTNKKNLYSRTLIKLPCPQFVVFYNGTEDTADHEVMKLSDAFEGSEKNGRTGKLELVVDVYNINMGHNSALLDACATLKGYAELVKRTRENQRTMAFPQAISKAVDDCIHEGILADFLKASKAEVVGVSIFEFDREEYERQVRAEEREDSEKRGVFKTLYELVKDNLLSLGNAAKKAGQSEKEFTAGMNEYFAQLSAAKQ